MAMECVPRDQKDRRARKRQRLGWDAMPPDVLMLPQAQLGMFIGQEAGNVASLARLKAMPACLPDVNGIAENQTSALQEDDSDGHYIFELGQDLTTRYTINSKLGEGTFGQVLECWDRERREPVAIKIIRSIKKYRAAALAEVSMLQKLAKHDKGGERCVQLRNWFDFQNHICIVFEKLGPSLYDFVRKNNHRPFPIDLVRDIGRQLLECVAFMHDLRLIHTDLKPENILLVSPEFVKVPDFNRDSSKFLMAGSSYKKVPKSSRIKVIDFGSATHDRKDLTYTVSTRNYRAPEVILGRGWSYPCDIWSIGCILIELCSGRALFQTHENLEHLAMMEKVLGLLPQHMFKKANLHAYKYVKKGRLDSPEGAVFRGSIRAIMKLPSLQDLLIVMTSSCFCFRVSGTWQNLVTELVEDSGGDMFDLLKGLLKYDPSDRLTAQEALKHPFFTRVLVD